MESSDVMHSPDPKFSPVSVSQSPVVRVQGNLTGTARQIRDLAADLYNYVQKWNSSSIKGVPLLQDIFDLKLPSLGSAAAQDAYPRGLQKKCDEVEVIFSDLVSVVTSMTSVAKYLEGIKKLEERRRNDIEPIFITWPVSKFECVASCILKAYEEELKLKRYVKENICHTSSKDQVLMLIALWVQQCYVDSDINFQLEAMLKETGHR